MRLAYRRRRHVLVELLASADPAAIAARARERGLAIQPPLAAYGRAGPALVIGYATPPAHAYTAALARLAAVLEEGRRSAYVDMSFDPNAAVSNGRTVRV